MIWTLVGTCVTCLVQLVLSDYSCVCNYAIDTLFYTSKDTSSPVQGHVYEFDCIPAQGTGSDDQWFAVIHDHQIGYMKKSSNVLQQECSGQPDIKDTVTTGATKVTSTTSASTTTTTAKTTTQQPTTPSTTRVSSTTSLTVPTTTQAPTTPTTTQITQRQSQSSTTDPSTTHAPTTQPSTTHAPVTHAPTTHAPITHVPATAMSTAAYMPKDYHCPVNVVSYALNHNGRTRVAGSSCYEIVPYLATWNAAEHNCQQKGGHLVHMSNLDEENIVMRFLYDHGFKHAVWIGLTDQGHEETFVWSSGDSFRWSKWMPGRYSNFYHHSNEDCVVLVPYIHTGFLQSYGQWDDILCNILHPWVCRYHAVDSHGNQVTTGSAHLGTTRPPYLAALDGLMQKTTQKPNSLADVLHNIFGK